MSLAFSHRTVNMVYKRDCRNCPISSCGAKYPLRLANHLADVHQIDHIQRRQYLQHAKLQPKVKVYHFYMFALVEIARIYKALKRFADLQGPICYNDAQNKGMNLIVY